MSITPQEWGNREVGNWLKAIGNAYGQYAPIFEENAIDGEILSMLDEESISDLVEKKIHRVVILKHLKKLLTNAVESPRVVQPTSEPPTQLMARMSIQASSPIPQPVSQLAPQSSPRHLPQSMPQHLPQHIPQPIAKPIHRASPQNIARRNPPGIPHRSPLALHIPVSPAGTVTQSKRPQRQQPNPLSLPQPISQHVRSTVPQSAPGVRPQSLKGQVGERMALGVLENARPEVIKRQSRSLPSKPYTNLSPPPYKEGNFVEAHNRGEGEPEPGAGVANRNNKGAESHEGELPEQVLRKKKKKRRKKMDTVETADNAALSFSKVVRKQRTEEKSMVISSPEVSSDGFSVVSRRRAGKSQSLSPTTVPDHVDSHQQDAQYPNQYVNSTSKSGMGKRGKSRDSRGRCANNEAGYCSYIRPPCIFTHVRKTNSEVWEPDRVRKKICHDFNLKYRDCSETCYFKHMCLNCYGLHGVYACDQPCRLNKQRRCASGEDCILEHC